MGATSVPEQQSVTAPTAAEAVLPSAPQPIWTAAAARDLAAAIADSAQEGLNPDDYRLAALKRAIAAGEGAALDAVAQGSATLLAHDYQYGHVVDRAGLGWHIDRDGAAFDPIVLNGAVQRGEVRSYLKSLLPTDARYAALREALASAPEGVTRDRIRVNMERWRWMPRQLGSDYLYVNVPSYQLKVIDDGATESTYTVVVGAKDTPTPWIAGDAPSLVVNPWWTVPQSIIKSANMRPGRGAFVWKATGSGWSARQAPGPRNALGRLKINLTNDQAIYLHDTPAKAGFARDDRALSHGCIRVKDIDRLAAELMAMDGNDAGRLDEALAGRETQTLHLPKRMNVYLVYFTMDRNDDGEVVQYADPYGRDAQVLARLGGERGRSLQVASN